LEQPSGGPHYSKPEERIFVIKMSAQREKMIAAIKKDITNESLAQDAFIQAVRTEFNGAMADLWDKHVKPWAKDMYGKNR
jgi:hypothetical protein